jgi:hypothetical protein
MKMKLGLAALTMVLALSGAGFASPMKTKKVKYSAAHKEAVKKCNDDYAAAQKDAKGKKGKERKEAEMAAKQARKQCIAGAPM